MSKIKKNLVFAPKLHRKAQAHNHHPGKNKYLLRKSSKSEQGARKFEQWMTIISDGEVANCLKTFGFIHILRLVTIIKAQVTW